MSPTYTIETAHLRKEYNRKVAVADLDHNGDLEIVVTTHNGAVYAFHHDGSDVAGWPTTPARQCRNSNARQPRSAM